VNAGFVGLAIGNAGDDLDCDRRPIRVARDGLRCSSETSVEQFPERGDTDGVRFRASAWREACHLGEQCDCAGPMLTSQIPDLEDDFGPTLGIA
jgi:hypothetical protein